MAGRIPQHFIDDLISRVDIVEVIDTRVPLKKAGREYTACCPFHDEKTPSFTVSPTKQFYHCFGCGAHGTVIGFLMAYEHKDFVEAVEELAGHVGLPVPREGVLNREAPATEPIYRALREAAAFYRERLQHGGERATAYVARRGLDGATVDAFMIGFAPPGWDNLRQALKGVGERHLAAAGLLIEKSEGGYYDRFRDRLMFPIRDAQGRVIAFGGRVLGDEKPKYLNSPETVVFHKGRELYGLYEARQALRILDRLLVVEGYMDVVSLTQYGIRNAVATLGTAVTSEHLQRLFRVCPEVVFCFDGDRAGRDAAWRGLQNALPSMRDGRQVRFMFLPEGEDPDTLVRRLGPEEFEAKTVSAIPLSDFLFRQIRGQVDMSSLDGRARLVELARPLLVKIPEGAFRELATEQLADIARMERQALRALIWGAEGGAVSPVAAARRPRRPQKGADAPSPVRTAIGLLLQAPTLARLVPEPEALAGITLPGISLLVEMLELLHSRPHLTTAGVLEHWRGSKTGEHLMRLAAREAILGEEEALEAEFRGALELLLRQREHQRRELLLRKPFKELTNIEKQELQQLLRKENSGNA